MVSQEQRRLLTLCAIRIDGQSIDWNVIAREVQSHRGVELLYRGHIIEQSAAASVSLPLLRAGLKNLASAEERVEHELALAEKFGARLVTVLDGDYPVNLRLIPDRPPFLFYRGEFRQREDARSVAVVGTRTASPDGLRQAATMARLLVDHGVTVTSGLAEGIDTAAHRATLDSGGRTIAVLGTGITKVFPAANSTLSEEIATRGVLVSQFWPSMRPSSWTFPRRNIVISGISQGTVVVEASSTSGAKMQARIAIEHGKRVWLVGSLVLGQEWARRYLERGAVKVDNVEDVVAMLADPERLQRAAHQQQQLALEIL